ncbi:hypothetical protein PG997_011116 [Apiospora hydei]|uniref:Myosin heavy chain n=1 Tax=Apiospora hydei TaxID=1337664 RepID=A0ABR1VI90_9PEZI
MVVDSRNKAGYRDAQTALEEEYRAANATIRQLTAEKKEFEGHGGTLRQKLSECTDKVEEVRQQLTKEKKDLEEQLTKEKQDLEEQLKKLQDNSEESKDTIERLTKEKESLEAKLESDKQAFESSLENERKDFEEKLTKAQGESQNSAEMIQQLTNDKQELEQKLKSSEDDAQQSSDTITQLAGENKDLEAKLEKALEDDGSKEIIRQLTDEKQDLEQKLKSSEDNAQSSSDTIRELTSEKKDLEQTLKSFEDDAQNSSDTIIRLESENKTLEAKLQKALEDDGSELLIRQLADEKANVEEELERHKNGANLQIQKLTRDKEDLEEKLENEGQNHENELESQKEALEKQLEALQAKFHKYINDTDEDRRAMVDMHERSVEKMAKLMADYQACGEAVTRLEGERKEARSALAKYKAKNTKLREEMQGLQKELGEARKRVKKGGGADGSGGRTATNRTFTPDTTSSATRYKYDRLLEYYSRVEEALKWHKIGLEEGGQQLVQEGGKQADFDNYQANLRASYKKTKGNDGKVLEPFSEIAAHLRGANIHIEADAHLVGSIDDLSASFHQFNFLGPRKPRSCLSQIAAIPQRLVQIPKRLVAIPQRLLGWANSLGLMPLINLFMFLFFLAATLAEGSKYAHWGRPNATSRALFAENRAYVCVSAPHMTFFYDMVRDVLGIPRLA